MLRLLAFLVFFPGTRVPAQKNAAPRSEAFARRLAAEVCACMEGITDEVARTFARRCLRLAGLNNRRVLSKAFNRGFIPERAADLDALAEYLTPPLAKDCPILQTLYAPGREPERRWSDQPLSNPTDDRLRYPKQPPPDPAETIVGERAAETYVEGTVETVGSKILSVRTADGRRTAVHLPPARRRTRQINPGQSVRLRCRREWRTAEAKIILILLE